MEKTSQILIINFFPLSPLRTYIYCLSFFYNKVGLLPHTFLIRYLSLSSSGVKKIGSEGRLRGLARGRNEKAAKDPKMVVEGNGDVR